LGDLIDRQVEVEAEGHDDPVVRREVKQRRPEQVTVLGLAVGVSGGGERNLIGDVPRLPAGRAGQSIPARVDEDPVEPRLEPRRIAERRPFAPGLDVGIVRGVLRLGRIAEDGAGKPVGGVEVGLRQVREGRGTLVRLLARGRAPIWHGHDLDWLSHDDTTNDGGGIFNRRRRGPIRRAGRILRR
jgi:hypothetical protein